MIDKIKARKAREALALRSNLKKRKLFQKKNKKKIIVIKNKKSTGLPKIANKILNKSKGEYIMRLDGDDWLENYALEMMINPFNSNNKIAVVYGNYFYTDEKGNLIGFENKYDPRFIKNIKHFPAHGACTLFKKKILKKVGGYSENLNAQDGVDIWQKIAKKNNIFHIKAPIFNYRQHENSLSKNNKRILNARVELFKNLSKKNKKKKLKCLAVIPVRESYPHFPSVPFQKINNKTLLELALSSSIETKEISKIIVSTNSAKVAEFVKQHYKNKKVSSLKRKTLQAGRFANIRQILIEACEKFKKDTKNYPDLVFFLSIHAPFRTSKFIKKALDVIIANNYDTVVSANIEYDPIFKNSEKGLKLINPGRFDQINFEKENLYRFNGSIILTKFKTLVKSRVFKDEVGYIEMPYDLSHQVKTLNDLKRVKILEK